MTKNAHHKKWLAQIRELKADLKRRRARGSKKAAALQISYEKKMTGIEKDLKRADRKLKSARKTGDKTLYQIRKDLDKGGKSLRKCFRNLTGR